MGGSRGGGIEELAIGDGRGGVEGSSPQLIQRRGRERLVYITSQASGGCVGVDTQEGFRLSCQLQTRGVLVS